MPTLRQYLGRWKDPPVEYWFTPEPEPPPRQGIKTTVSPYPSQPTVPSAMIKTSVQIQLA